MTRIGSQHVRRSPPRGLKELKTEGEWTFLKIHRVKICIQNLLIKGLQEHELIKHKICMP